MRKLSDKFRIKIFFFGGGGQNFAPTWQILRHAPVSKTYFIEYEKHKNQCFGSGSVSFWPAGSGQNHGKFPQKSQEYLTFFSKLLNFEHKYLPN